MLHRGGVAGKCLLLLEVNLSYHRSGNQVAALSLHDNNSGGLQADFTVVTPSIVAHSQGRSLVLIKAAATTS